MTVVMPRPASASIWGGIVLSHPQWGLEAELRGRGLLSHAVEVFRDQGFSASLSWQQHPDSALGAALSLTQTMGGSSSRGPTHCSQRHTGGAGRQQQ